MKSLDTIHHQGLRLALGAFRTSPVESLYAESNEPSLYIRREKLSLQYVTKLAANPRNSAYDCVFNPKYERFYNNKPTAIKPLGLRIQPLLEEANINIKNVQHFSFPSKEFLVISSKEDKPITSLSPFIIEKQIESLIGTPKNVKKLKNGTLLVETNRKSQTDNLLKITKFFNINVSVTEHKTLNCCKGIIRDRMLKHETEENITEYLNTQGVTACKRFKIKKDGNFIETNTLLLTFNTTTLPNH